MTGRCLSRNCGVLLVAATLGLLLTPSRSAERPYYPPPEARGGWRSLVEPNVEPSAAQKAGVRDETGLDWDKMQAAWRYCLSQGKRSSLLVIRHGWIAGEWHTFTEPLGIASCTKSLTAVAMAKLFDLSDARQLPKRIGPGELAYRYLPPSWAEEEPARKKIRIRHMMTMSSGLDPYDGPYRDLEAYRRVIVTRKVEAAPGTVWAYASAPVDLLSLIIENVTGQKLGDFIRERIEDPIGVGPVEWREFHGHTGGSGGPGGGARYTPRELARIGYLMLQKGVWDKGSGPTQVLSAKRVALISSWAPFLGKAAFRMPNMGTAKPGSQQFYGYLWWTNRTGEGLSKDVPADAYYMQGWGRQVCVVIPSLDMVAVRLGPDAELNKIADYLPQMMAPIVAAVADR